MGIWGGGCLCSMSVLLKSLFIIRNITPTYVQPCLALCFGEGSWFSGGRWEFWGVLVSPVMVTLTWGCAFTPGCWCRRQNPWGGGFGGAKRDPPSLLLPPDSAWVPLSCEWGCSGGLRLLQEHWGVPGEFGVHGAVGTLPWGGPCGIWGVRGHGGHCLGGSLQDLGCSGRWGHGPGGLIWVRRRSLRAAGGSGTRGHRPEGLIAGGGGSCRAAEGSRGPAVLRPRRGAEGARGMLGVVVQRREGCREL